MVSRRANASSGTRKRFESTPLKEEIMSRKSVLLSATMIASFLFSAPVQACSWWVMAQEYNRSNGQKVGQPYQYLLGYSKAEADKTYGNMRYTNLTYHLPTSNIWTQGSDCGTTPGGGTQQTQCWYTVITGFSNTYSGTTATVAQSNMQNWIKQGYKVQYSFDNCGSGGKIYPTQPPPVSQMNYWYAKGPAGENGPVGTDETTARNTAMAWNGQCFKYDTIFIKSGPLAGTRTVSLPEPTCTAGYGFYMRPMSTKTINGRPAFMYQGQWYYVDEFRFRDFKTKQDAYVAIDFLRRSFSSGGVVTKSVYCTACDY